MSSLKGKVAVVTGASKGIGAGIARELAAAGASVVGNYATSKDDADRVVAEILNQDGKAIAVRGDVSKAADVKRLFAETNKAFGSLDVLVNNAGVYAFQPLEAITEQEFHRHFNINVLGLILATQEALKYFGPSGGSVIDSDHAVAPHERGVHRNQGRGGYDHAHPGEGARAKEDSGELDKSRRDGDGGGSCVGTYGNRTDESVDRPDTARAHRATA